MDLSQKGGATQKRLGTTVLKHARVMGEREQVMISIRASTVQEGIG